MARTIRLAGAGAVAAALLATPALAQSWTDWDGDADGALTAEEFSQGLAARMNFAAWDADADGELTQEELSGWFLARYDRDGTDAIEEVELGDLEGDFTEEGIWVPKIITATEILDSEGSEDASGDVATADEAVDLDSAALPNWDIDGDGLIVAHEFMDGFADWGTFAELDGNGDGGITEDELASEIFARYDEDGNGLIAEPEAGAIGDDLGEGGFWDS